MNGIVTGGWNFVLAAYSITALILGAYAFRVIADFRRRNTQ